MLNEHNAERPTKLIMPRQTEGTVSKMKQSKKEIEALVWALYKERTLDETQTTNSQSQKNLKR